MSFDVESNGLHGEAFAVGAVLMDSRNREVLDDYIARCPIVGQVDSWTRENVLPSLADLPEEHGDALQLRQDFWTWYERTKSRADAVLADNPYPVEARFLISCQDDCLPERYWEHPLPLLDLGSLFFSAGITSAADRDAYVSNVLRSADKVMHNPRWDAWAAAMTAFSLLGQ